MATDQLGNVFIATCNQFGNSIFSNYPISDSGNHVQALVLKVNAAGNILWVIASEHAEVTPVKITTDKEGNTYLLGVYYFESDSVLTIGGIAPDNPSDTPDHSLYFMAKIEGNGHVDWVKNIVPHIPGVIDVPDDDGAIGIDDSGNIYVAGSFWTSSVTIGSYTIYNATTPEQFGLYSSNLFLARYDKWGNPIWAKSIGGKYVDANPNIAIGPSGNIYCSAFSEDSFLKVDNIILNFNYDTVNYSGYTTIFSSQSLITWVTLYGQRAWRLTMSLQ